MARKICFMIFGPQRMLEKLRKVRVPLKTRAPLAFWPALLPLSDTSQQGEPGTALIQESAKLKEGSSYRKFYNDVAKLCTTFILSGGARFNGSFIAKNSCLAPAVAQP